MSPAGGGAGPVAALLAAAVRAGRIPGASVAWGVGQSPLAAAVGQSRIGAAGEPARPSVWYDLASLTKPLVVTTLILLAFRRGELEPDTRVGEALDETRGTPVSGATLASLLTHTSGLPDWLPLYALGPGPEAVAATIGQHLSDAPVERRIEYSCLGFILLGRVLQAVTEASLDRLFTDRVLRPLGLEDELGFHPSPERSVAGGAAAPTAERQLTTALGLDPRSVPPVGAHDPDDGNARFLGGVAGNSGLFGTARGVYRLAREYLPGGGDLLSGPEAKLATSPSAADGEGVRGLGWQLAATAGSSAGPSLGSTAFGHVGFTGTSVWAEPTRGAVMVLLANRHHPGHRGVDLHPLRRRFNTLALRNLP